MNISRNPHWRGKVDLWCNFLNGTLYMDRATYSLVARSILSFFMLGLVYTGDVSGTAGIIGATVTSGIDIAAFLEAVKETQTDSTEQTVFDE
jgi:hypothetical protein